MKYKEIFSSLDMKSKTTEIFNTSNFVAQNIDCVHTLPSPLRGGSKTYSQSMFFFLSKMYTYERVYPSFTNK